MTHDQSERVRPTLLPGLIVLLLLGIPALHLLNFSVKPSKPYITIPSFPSVAMYSEPSIRSSVPIALRNDQRADLLARTPNGQWFKVSYEGLSLWVLSIYVKPSIDPVQIPVESFVMHLTPTLIIFMSDLPAASTSPAPSAAQPTSPAQMTPNLTYSPEPSSKAYVTLLQGVNVRSGPSSLFNPIGSLEQAEQADLLARSPDGQWFKIKYYTGSGWVYAQYTKASSSPFEIPVEVGPPPPTLTPTPMTPTPTITPIASMTPSPPTNLVLGNINFNPPLPLMCGKTVAISVDVANLGNEATTSSGSITIRDIVASTRQEVGYTSGGFGPIQQGQTINISGIFLLVISPVDEDHKLIVTVNSDRSLPETDYDDNSREFTYQLQGDCG